MSIKSGLFAGITAVVLMLIFGNGWVVERARDGGDFAFQTRTSVTSQLQLQVWDLPSEIRTATVVRLILLVVLTAGLGAFVGRARPLAAFVGGWGAFLAASVLSAGVYGLVVDDRFVARPGSDAVDTFTLTASFGTAPGIWLGWLVGIAVLLGSFGKGQPKAAPGLPPAAPAPAWGAPPTDPAAPPGPGPFGPSSPDAAPAWDQPAPPAPSPPPPGGPVIGTPPDRTQIYGEPPTHDR